MPDENIILNPDGDNRHIPQLSSGLYNNWRNLWEKNATLKSKRRNPLILFHGDKDPDKKHQDPLFPTDPGKSLPGNAGDTVVRPDASEKTSGGTVDSHNPFTTASDKVFLRLRVLDDEFKQFKDAKWVLHIDGRKYPEDPAVESAFEDGGLINLEVPKTARIGKLTVRIPPPPSGSSSGAPSSSPPLGSGSPPPPPPPIEIEFWLNIGRLDPIKDLSPAPDDKFTPGVQQRLNNLGFGASTVNGVLTPATESAIRRFQKRFGVTEEKDSKGKYMAGPLTQAELERLHDQPNKPPPPTATQGASKPTTQPQTQATTPPPSGGTQAVTGQAPPAADTPLAKAKQKVETANAKYKAARQKTSTAYAKWQRGGSEDDFTAYNTAKSEESQAKRELDQAMTEQKRLESKT